MELDKLFCITEKNWYKIISWASIAYDEDKNEISGLATAVPDKDGIFTIGDISFEIPDDICKYIESDILGLA